MVTTRNWLTFGCDLLLLPAEELDVGLGDRLAGDGVGDEVEGLAVELLLDDDRVVDPDDDPADVAVRHLAP